jgi:AraC-like DNA-binding protein
MRTVLLSFILLSPCLAAAQTNNLRYNKDSLLNVIAASEGPEKLNAYVILTNQVVYSTEQSDTLFLYYKEAIRESQKQKNRRAEAEFKESYIISLYNYERRKELMKTAPVFLDFFAENGCREKYYAIYGILIETILNECMFDTAIREAKILYDKASRQNDLSGMGAATFNIGVTYQKLRRYSDAEEYFRKTITILAPMDKEPNMLFDTYFVLSEVLSEQKRHSEALEAAQRLASLIDRKEKRDSRTYPTMRYSCYLIQAIIYLGMNEFEKAESFLDLAEKEVPDIERARINIYFHRAQIAESRKDYSVALKLCDAAYHLCEAMGEYPFSGEVIKIKSRVLSGMRGSEDLFGLFEQYIAIRDSIEGQKLHAQIDEIRTQYEVDKITAEKERNRNNFLFALAGCILLATALAIRIYYNRQIAGKNRALSRQIKELTAQQELRDAELLNKTSFIDGDVRKEDGFCPESRKDRLCVAIRDLILRDKAYRNPVISRDYMIERLHTSRELFVEAFMFCFGMSFTEYINGLRLKDAVTLLEQSDLSIEDISKKTGFGTVRTFQRQFQLKYNMSPKDYRNSAKLS